MKIKQENKALRESSVSNGDSSSGSEISHSFFSFVIYHIHFLECMELEFVTLIFIFSSQYLDRYSVSTNLDLTFPLALSTEIKSVLDKHSIALEKQKENTTKLSKLCLGTLNELEKFEKKAEQVCFILIQFSKYLSFSMEE